RRLTARIFWLHNAPLAVGGEVTVRIAAAQARGTVAAIRNAVDPGAPSADAATVVAQNNIADVEIALAAPIAADPHDANPRTGRVVIAHAGRIAGGGLVLALDGAAVGAATVVEVPATLARSAVELGAAFAALTPAERLARF